MGNRFGFVCLANSRKAGGRCVAGKAFKKSSRRWVWVRPVNQYNKLPVENSLLNTGNEPKICDWIHLDWLEKHSGLAYQPENFLFQSKKWQWKGVVKENYLNQLTDRPETLWDNISSTRAGINDKVTLEKANGYNHSLYFIKAEDVVFHGIQNSFDPYNLKKKVEFTYNDSRYKLSLTDPYENQITQIQSFEVQKDFNVYLTISLGEPFNEEAYKLVAGVVFVKEIDDKTLFTIGHSTHEIDHFISLLKKI